MKYIGYLQIPFFIFIIFFSFCSSDKSVETEKQNFLEYFPIGNNYKWVYEVNSNIYLKDLDSVYVRIDTIIYKCSITHFYDIDTTIYRYDQDGRALFDIYLINDKLFSFEHLGQGKLASHIYWKSDFKINEEWKMIGLSDPGPRIKIEINNKLINASSKILVKGEPFNNCILLSSDYFHLIGHHHYQTYYAKDIGIVYCSEISESMYGKSNIEYNLLYFEKGTD